MIGSGLTTHQSAAMALGPGFRLCGKRSFAVAAVVAAFLVSGALTLATCSGDEDDRAKRPAPALSAGT